MKETIEITSENETVSRTFDANTLHQFMQADQVEDIIASGSFSFDPNPLTFDRSDVGSWTTVSVHVNNRFNQSSTFKLYFEVTGKAQSKFFAFWSHDSQGEQWHWSSSGCVGSQWWMDTMPLPLTLTW